MATTQQMLPTIELGKHQVTRLIIGGNPFSGFSHQNAQLDREMIEYYTMPRLQATLDECWRQGINTVQSRGDRHQMRMFLEYRLRGGQMQWIAQTASEFANIYANIAQIASYEPIAIYHHGTHTDNSWHSGQIDAVADIVKAIKDTGRPAGVGTHIPEVIEYAEEHEWETDFYMGCFYNLARAYKSAPAVERDAYQADQFPAADPERMTAVLRQVPKPCLGFKILAAGRNCADEQTLEATFRYAFDHLKPTDAVVVGMFPKYSNQVAQNAGLVRRILDDPATSTV